MNVPMKGGPAPTVAVVPVPESEMDALLLGRTAVRNFDQYVRNVCIAYSLHLYCFAGCKPVHSFVFVTAMSKLILALSTSVCLPFTNLEWGFPLF